MTEKELELYKELIIETRVFHGDLLKENRHKRDFLHTLLIELVTQHVEEKLEKTPGETIAEF